MLGLWQPGWIPHDVIMNIKSFLKPHSKHLNDRKMLLSIWTIWTYFGKVAHQSVRLLFGDGRSTASIPSWFGPEVSAWFNRRCLAMFLVISGDESSIFIHFHPFSSIFIICDRCTFFVTWQGASPGKKINSQSCPVVYQWIISGWVKNSKNAIMIAIGWINRQPAVGL